MSDKWSGIILIVISDYDSIIASTIRFNVLKYNIKGAFYLETLTENSRNKLDENHLNPLTTGCLKLFNDAHLKILLVGHGVGEFEHNPNRLIVSLHEAGLRQCGLISFKGCCLGCDDFLDRFTRSCYELDLIKVGFLSGYVGSSISPLMYSPCSHESVGAFQLFLNTIFCCSCCFPIQLPDFMRVKVVRGNHNIVPLCGPTSRFPAQQEKSLEPPVTDEAVQGILPPSVGSQR
ncbi:hypothetical protein [Candidatus Sororendozoicomonas aggregata]|uniref:hypothetical protein n=1 Tax=Candidatus Sororendozoicomonas aggregata TaxID=3073239 RepID=UPI002ED3B846